METANAEKPITKKVVAKDTPKVKKKKTNKWILLLVVLFVVSAVNSIFVGMNSQSINLTMAFSEVSEGKNPDGSAFDIQQILNDEVLSMAAAKLGGEVDVETLRRHLSVSHNVSASDHAKTKQNILDGNDEYAAVPSTYRLTYSTVSEKIKNDGVGASFGAVFEQAGLKGGDEILTAVAESYCEYHNKKYTNTGDIFDIDRNKIDGLDYYNRASAVLTEAGQMNRFLIDKYNKNAEFVSEKEGIGYGELQTELSNIINVDIENFKAFIVQNGLTVNETKLLNQFRYMEMDNHETNYRQLAIYDVIKEAIDYYDSDVTKVVFIPALDYDKSFYMNRTKVGIDYMIENAASTKNAADSALHNEKEYQQLQAQFKAVPDADAKKIQEADRMYGTLIAKIDNLAQKAKNVVQEEMETNRCIQIKSGKVFYDMGYVALAIECVKVFVMLAAAAYLIVVFLGLFRKKEEI